MTKNKTKVSFRKGNLVTLNVATCFTEQNHGGERDYPLSNWHNDDAGIVLGHRKPTADELESWYSSDESKGINSAGETKLPPIAMRVPLYKDECVTVVRGQAKMDACWDNPKSGYAVVQKRSGECCFVLRELLTNA